MRKRWTAVTGVVVGVAALQVISGGLSLGVSPASAETTDNGCVGDCSQDGNVTVDEILTLVNIALGSVDLSACPRGVPSGVQQVTVTEILTAVSNALTGCPMIATPTPTATATATVPGTTPGPPVVAAAAVSGHASVVADAAGVIADVVAAVANGFVSAASIQPASSLSPQDSPGGQAAGSCPAGGTATKTGNAFFGETVTLTGCKADTFDGTVTFDGSVLVGLLSPFNMNVTATFRDQGGAVLEVASANATGSVSPTLGGNCYLTQANFTLTGALTSTRQNGQMVGINLMNTTVKVSNITFSPTSCVPTVYDLTFNGMAELLDPNGGTEDVTFNQLVLHFDTSSSTTILTVNGGLTGTCFGGAATLVTQTPLSVPAHQNCPTMGVIEVTSPQGQATVTFNVNSVVVQSPGNGSINAQNCLDPRLLVCAA